MGLKELRGKPLVYYPCEWEYRIIGRDTGDIRQAVEDVVGDRVCTLREANRKGKYVSMSMKLVVDSEEQRNRVHRMLVEHEHVRMVL